MINKDEIMELLITKSYEKNSVLVRFPLPLKFFIGKILTINEFSEVKDTVSKLVNIKKIITLRHCKLTDGHNLWKIVLTLVKIWI